MPRCAPAPWPRWWGRIASARISASSSRPRARGEALDHVLLYGPPGLGKCITGDSLVLTGNGLVSLRALIPPDLQPGDYAPCSALIYGRDGPALTSHVYANGCAPTIRLRTRSGFELEGTPNHPILVAAPDGPQWKTLSELDGTDYVAIARSTALWGQPQPIDFQPTYLNNTDRRDAADRQTLAAHAALITALGRPPTSVELAQAYGTALEHNPTPLVSARRLGLPLSDGRSVPSQRDVRLPVIQVAPVEWRAPNQVDADLAYLMGLLVGDGHFEGGANAPAFVITASEAEIQAEIIRIAREKFDWEPQIRQYGTKAPRVRFGQNIGHLMIELGVHPVLAGEKVVPSAVLLSPADVARAFLQGLFDADGHAWQREGYVDWSSKSVTLARTGATPACQLRGDRASDE